METLKDNEMWFLCREPFYDLDSLDSAMTDIANKQGKDSIVTVLTEKTGILLLEDSPVLTDGENTITGDSIRYYIYENRSEVIRGKNKRVEATFMQYSNEKVK